MDKKINLLVDEPCPELLCGICSDVLEDPIQVHCPEDHMFCNKCIQQHIEHNSYCPMCLTELDKNTFQLSKFVQRQISRLRIKCLYADNGCQWAGVLSDDHIDNCEHKPSACPNMDKGCDVTSANMEEHLKSCLYQTIECPNHMPLCEPFLLKDLSKHDNECPSYTCAYAAEGCPFIGTLAQAESHCELYCGQLHKKVDTLEGEIKRLNKLIQDITLGLDIKLPSTPDTHMQEDDKKQHDTSMDDLDLFQQMFGDDSFAALSLTSSSITSTATTATAATTTTTTTTATMDEKPVDNMMDLTNIDFLKDEKKKDNFELDLLFDTATSPQPLQFMMPLSAPKRTSNGKKIRYRKNKLLAHNALRIARQRTASSNHNPTNDAILNNLDLAKQKQSQVVFKNVDDVTKFLNTDTPSSQSPKTSAKKEKKKSVSSPQPSSDSNAPSPVSTTTTTTTTTTPKRRPMFILASSYLSNYNSDKV